MQFTDKVQDQFKKAGWKADRNVKNDYRSVLRIEEYPQFLKDFLFEYGDLTVLDCKLYDSNVINKLKLEVAYAGYEDEEDYQGDLKKFGKPLFPFGFFDPDCYMVACDADGKVYLLGDYTFRIADTLKDGIEILIKDDWSKGYYQLDEKTGKWVKDKKWNE